MAEETMAQEQAEPEVEFAPHIIDRMIDRGARYLRESTQKTSVAWQDLPKSSKRKWIVKSEGFLLAALKAERPHD